MDSDDGDSYAKLGQIYADYSFNDSISIRVGRWVIGSVLLSDSDSRATPSSTQAIQLTNQFDKGQFYALYSDRASSKTDTSFTKYTDANGDDYGIVIVGGDIVLENGLSLAAAYGDADNYKQQTFLNAGFQVNENVALSLAHYNGEGEGTNAAFDSNLTNLAASYQFDNLKLSAAYQTISGDTGYDFTWGGDDDNVLQTSHSVQIMDFNRQDEDSWQLRADYAVSSIKGLSLMARHTWGDYTDSGSTVDEAETNVDVVYQLQSGSLQGLNLHMRLSNVNADAYDDINEVRLIANYSF